MQHQVVIRGLGERDIDAVTALYAEVLDPSYISFSELAEGKGEAFGRLSSRAVSIFREQLCASLGNSSHGHFVATSGNMVVGFALASLREAEAGHFECWLDDLVVGHPWQRRGVARTLVDQVLTWGADRGARYYLLESGVDNTVAHRVFEASGFRPLATVFWKDARL